MPYIRVPHRHNLRRRPFDSRDRRLTLAPAPGAPPPDDIDLCGKFMPPVWNQGPLGCCMAHGVNAAYAFERARQGLPPLTPDATPSRLFTYYAARDIEGTLDQGDCGSDIRDGVKSLCSNGPMGPRGLLLGALAICR